MLASRVTMLLRLQAVWQLASFCNCGWRRPEEHAYSIDWLLSLSGRETAARLDMGSKYC